MTDNSTVDSRRAKIAEQIAKGHIDTGFGEAMDELMAGELADKIERALASEYSRGEAVGRRSGIEEAAKVAEETDYYGKVPFIWTLAVSTAADNIRSLLTNEV